MRWSLLQVNKIMGDRKLLGAEIGVSDGTNARDILSGMNIEMLYAIDIWEKYHDHGERDHSRFLYQVYKEFMYTNNIKILHLGSVEASRLFENESLDFVYIDANHSYKYVKKDIESWLPKIKKGGVLCGHDINHKDVFMAVGDAFGDKKLLDGSDWMYINE